MITRIYCILQGLCVITLGEGTLCNYFYYTFHSEGSLCNYCYTLHSEGSPCSYSYKERQRTFVDLLEAGTVVPTDCLPTAVADRVGWRKRAMGGRLRLT